MVQTAASNNNHEIPAPERSKGFEVYSKNAYRILGLTASASHNQVVESAAAHRRANKIGRIKEADWDLPWFGTVPRTNSDIQNAESRLSDPETRLTERFFWLHAPALDCQTVPELCREWLSSGQPWSSHDVAVLRTISASLVDPRFTNEGIWTEVLESWSVVANTDDYWLLLMDTDVDGQFEPEISPSEISELQSSCLEKALYPIVLAAKDALAVGDWNTTQCAMRLLSHSTIPEFTRTMFEHEVAGTLEKEIEVLCNEFKDRCRNSIKREDNNTEIDISNNRKVCMQLKQSFQKDLEGRLEQMITIFGVNSDPVIRVREELAECLGSLATAFTWADDRRHSTDLLEKAASLVENSSAEGRINEQLDSMREQLQFEEAVEENEASYQDHKAFRVTLKGTQYSIPRVCPCCLGDPDSSISVRYEWEENYVVVRRKKSVSFNFPYCNQCKDHSLELEYRRFYLIIITAVSVIACGLLFQAYKSQGVLVFNIIFGVFFAFLWSKVISIKQLSSHCTRGDAVQILSANDHEVVFRFWNKRYADVFANFNRCQLSAQKATKHTFGTSLFKGKSRNQVIIWAVLFSLIPLLWVNSGTNKPSTTAAMEEPSNKEAITEPETPAASSEDTEQTSLEQEKRKATMLLLKEKMDSGRVRIKELEAELDAQKEQLQPLKEQIQQYKETLQSFEDQSSQGQEVDKEAYEQALNEHNSLVEQINTIVATHKKSFAEYNKLFEQDKKLVRQYNTLVRQQ